VISLAVCKKKIKNPPYQIVGMALKFSLAPFFVRTDGLTDDIPQPLHMYMSGKNLRKLFCNQCDQIVRIFAQWVIDYFGKFIEKYGNSPHFGANSFTR
jgi:hypothetical protein